MAEKYKFLSSGSRNLVGEPFDPYVAYQVKQRQETQFSGYESQRGDSDIQILNNQNAWVKMASGVSISGSLGDQRLRSLGLSEQEINGLNGTQLAESAILFNSLSSVDPTKGTSAASGDTSPITMREGIAKANKLWNSNRSYGLGGTDFGILPPPGITDVTVTCLNRGSIRRATVNLKAYNKFQFAIIEILYLQLGKHILLEWGNDKYIDNEGKFRNIQNTLIETNWFSNNGLNQLEMLEFINIYRAKYSANYDGFFGKVSNFSWDFGNDGSYDISIDLITVGDVIESLKVNTQQSLLTNKDLKEGKQTINTSAETALLNERVKSVLGSWLMAAMGEADNNKKSRNPNYFILENKDKESDNGKIIEKYKYFITLSELLELVENLCVPSILTGGKKVIGNKLVNFIPPNCVSYSLNQISLDPRVCLLKPKFSKSLQDKVYYPHYLDPLIEYATIENNVIYGNLNNLYLNYDFIFKCLEQNTDKEDNLSLFKFLSNLCDGINGALGHSVNLEPIIRNDRYITIIDQNPIANVENLFPESKEVSVPLEVYGYNPSLKQSNFVNNIKFQTSITPDLSSTISIGATAAGSTVSGVEGTAFSKWSIGLKDRFLEEVKNEKHILPGSDKELTRIITREEEDSLKKEYRAKWFANNNFINYFSLTNKKYFTDGSVDNGWYGRTEYIYSAFRRYKENLHTKVDKKELENELASNFVLYLGYCFGNNQLAVPGSEGSSITIPYRSPENSNYLKFDNNFISKGKKVYKKFLNGIATNTFKESIKKENLDEIEASNQIGFIPVNFDLSLKGISGFKIYQKLQINQQFLPSQYPKTLEFLVTKVDLKISNNHWTTNLSTLSVPKIKSTPKDETVAFPDVITIDDKDLIISTEYITPETDLPLVFRDNTFGGIIPLNSPPNRKWMERNFNQNVIGYFEKFFNNMINNPKLKGHTVFIKSTYRSPEEQQALVDAGATSTKPGRSLHNYGAAVDIVIAPPRMNSGRAIYASSSILTNKKFNDPEAQNWMLKNRRRELWINSGVKQNAKDAGLEWAGNWKSRDTYKDYVHFYVNEKDLTTRDIMEAALVDFGGGDKLKADGRKIGIKKTGNV